MVRRRTICIMKSNRHISKFFSTLKSGRLLRTSGFSVIEIIFTAAVFLIFSSGVIFVILQGFDANRTGSEETIANQYASEGIEAVRSIRNQAYEKLINTASIGLTRSPENLWTLSGANNTFNKYTRVISIADVRRDGSGNIVASGGTVDPNSKKITSTVSWKASPTRNSSVVLITYLTNWRLPTPVGHWKFDEGSGSQAFDSSGNGNTGTLTNGPAWTTGRIGQALLFDGVDDFVHFGSPSTFHINGDLTIAAWVKTTNTTKNEMKIIGHVAGVINRNYDLSLTTNADLYFSHGNGTTASSYATAGISLADNQWHHVAFTADYPNGRYYIDGSNVKNITMLFNIVNTSTASFRAGGTNPAFPGTMLVGSLDDFRIYNRALSPSEIQTIYNGG